jgi:hypothetical protein
LKISWKKHIDAARKLKPTTMQVTTPNKFHSYDILGARMLWKPKEARILKNFIEF